jgi:hypothetical protein
MMFGLRRRTSNRTRDTLKDVFAYIDELLRDQRLREDVGSAISHGVVATKRVRAGSDMMNLGARLVGDEELRSNLRSLLDDLDSAAERVRRRSSHRMRNVSLVIGGGGLALAAVPSTRHWIAEHVLGNNGATGSLEPEWNAEAGIAVT